MKKEHNFQLLRRRLLMSALALGIPGIRNALAKEEFATLKFVPADKPVDHHGVKPVSHTSRKKRHAGPRIVMIDPGHGGKDPGAIGHGGSEEKHVVLEIAKNVRDLLAKHKHIQVRLTREEDHFIPLYERVDIAHQHQADMFMSIHADGFTSPSANGASVFALSTRGASSAMARYLADRENAADNYAGIDVKTNDANLQRVIFDLVQTQTIRNSLDLSQHMIKNIQDVHHMHSRHPEQAAFVVLKSPSIPSVLIETSFITNPAEEKLLGTKAFRMKIAHAIAGGVLSYFAAETA